MGYVTGSSAILALLRGMSEWDSNNTSREDWSILNTGKSRRYAIIKPGEEGYENEIISLGNATQIRLYNTVIEIWILAQKPGTDLHELQTLVGSVIETFDRYPNLGLGLGNAINGAVVLGGGDMLERWADSRGATWLSWDVVIQWREERNTTSAET
jgi:hypothetical protein